MTKQEFLEGLRAALTSRGGASVVAENISYYEDYINTQVRMGRSEEEVIRELGDPRLLARSITEANKHAGMEQTQEEDYRRSSGEGGGYTDGYGNAYGPGQEYRRHSYRIPGWLIVFLVVFIGLMVLSAFFSVLSVLAPILLPVFLLVLVFRLLKRS